MKKIISIALVALMLATACLVPVSAENDTKVYMAVDFDNCQAGATVPKSSNNTILDTAGNMLYNGFKSSDSISSMENRYGSNNALRSSNNGGANGVASDHGLELYNGIDGANNFGELTTDLVFSYDVFISGDNGKAISLFNSKGYNTADTFTWSGAVVLDKFDANGTAALSFGSTKSTVRVNKGEWFNVAIVLKHTNDTTTCKDDVTVYVNGELALSGANIWNKSRMYNFAKFQGGAACVEDCYILLDNIRVYSGTELKSDAELGLSKGAQFAGVQESAVDNGAFNVRFISAIDALQYDGVGFDITASYTEGGVAKTKTVKKTYTAAYTKITANTGAGIVEYAAEDLGGQYLYALAVKGVPAEGKVVFLVKTFSVEGSAETVQSIYEVTYNNGAFVSIVEK